MRCLFSFLSNISVQMTLLLSVEFDMADSLIKLTGFTATVCFKMVLHVFFFNKWYLAVLN